MNNQMPYYDGQNPYQNFHLPPNNEMMFDRINNRINRLERQIKILENRINRLENVSIMPLKNNQDDDNMYML